MRAASSASGESRRRTKARVDELATRRVRGSTTSLNRALYAARSPVPLASARHRAARPPSAEQTRAPAAPRASRPDGSPHPFPNYSPFQDKNKPSASRLLRRDPAEVGTPPPVVSPPFVTPHRSRPAVARRTPPSLAAPRRRPPHPAVARRTPPLPAAQSRRAPRAGRTEDPFQPSTPGDVRRPAAPSRVGAPVSLSASRSTVVRGARHGAALLLGFTRALVVHPAGL
jgi:hypothetical protein